jgi:hypothetical protein
MRTRIPTLFVATTLLVSSGFGQQPTSNSVPNSAALPGVDTKAAAAALPAQKLIQHDGDVRIAKPTVWQNAHHRIRGNLYLEPGGKLELEACTIELMCEYSRQFEIRWRGGSLVSRRSTLGGTVKDGIIHTINFEVAHGDWTATDTTIRHTSGILLGSADKPARFEATRLIQGPQPDSLIMSGTGQAILSDSTYNISLTADVKEGGTGLFDLPTKEVLNRTFDTSNVPGAAWRLQLHNTTVPLWFLFVNCVSMHGPPAEIRLVRCSSLIPSIMGANLRGEMRLPAPWPHPGARPDERVLRTGNVTWRATGNDVSVACWGLYLWGDKTDLTLSGQTLIAELMLYEGRCAMVGTAGTFEAATFATTIEVGRDEPPSRAELTLRHVKIGRFDKTASIKGQITAHGNSRVEIRDALCADLVLVTRGKGEISATNLNRQGRIISLQQGGPIRVDKD